MTTALIFATVKGISAANLQLILGILLAISEALGADSRVKANGIISFLLLQAQNVIKKKKEEV
jgi:hypothetical protein